MEWTNVNERLPDDLDKYYLVYEISEEGYQTLVFDVCFIEKSERSGEYYWHDGDGRLRCPDYWMPLPDAPKKEIVNNDPVKLPKGESEYSSIVFNIDKQTWIMKLTEDGIFFNREAYPNSSPGDFADAIIRLLELSYDVKFTKKDNNEKDSTTT